MTLVTLGQSGLSWAAEVDRGRLQSAEQRLTEGNAAASAQDYTKAIGLYQEGLKLLEESAGGQRVSDTPSELQGQYSGLSLELTRNYIVAHFQNGQALAKQGADKIDKAVQLAQQTQRKDPARIKEAGNDLQEAARYFDLTLQLIENVAVNAPENKTVLDQNVRFELMAHSAFPEWSDGLFRVLPWRLLLQPRHDCCLSWGGKRRARICGEATLLGAAGT